MVSTFVRNDADSGPDIAGVDRHYYEKQVPPSSPFNDTSFQIAAAVAKDRARHQLIRAIEKADADARGASFTGFGNDSLTGQLSVSRSIDGNDQAPLNDIKL